MMQTAQTAQKLVIYVNAETLAIVAATNNSADISEQVDLM